MSEIKDLPATLEADPTSPSTADHNVERARRRRDAITPEVRAAAFAMIGRHLSAMSRQPFRDLLTDLIGAAPTPEAIRRFADKYPDRWAQAVSIVAGLSGYERGIVEVNVFNIKGLSDSALMARLVEVEGQLEAAKRGRLASDRHPEGVSDAQVIEMTGKRSAEGSAEKASPAARADHLDSPVPV